MGAGPLVLIAFFSALLNFPFTFISERVIMRCCCFFCHDRSIFKKRVRSVGFYSWCLFGLPGSSALLVYAVLGTSTPLLTAKQVGISAVLSHCGTNNVMIFISFALKYRGDVSIKEGCCSGGKVDEAPKNAKDAEAVLAAPSPPPSPHLYPATAAPTHASQPPANVAAPLTTNVAYGYAQPPPAYRYPAAPPAAPAVYGIPTSPRYENMRYPQQPPPAVYAEQPPPPQYDIVRFPQQPRWAYAPRTGSPRMSTPL
jgi:hypothetical protein